MALNPLANPKGVSLCCELCSKPAFISCTKCRVTFYCDEEHQNIDWIGIHEKICQLLIPLRMPVPFTSGSEDARDYQRQQQIIRQKQMIELTRRTGQKLLFEEKYEYAVPAAMQSLKFSIDVYGLSSIEIVPSYLILGEACIGLGRLSQAEDYLSQAQWTVIKTPECTSEMKSRLHRNLGMLHAKQGNSDKALKELAEAIYQASSAYGTDDIRTSGGYFHMANIFYEEDKLDIACSIFDHLTSIWYDHLLKLVKQRTKTLAPPVGIGPAQFVPLNDDIDYLDETKGAEAAQILHGIQSLREKQTSSSPAVMAKVYFTLGMLYLVLPNNKLAIEFTSKAATILQSNGIQDDQLRATLSLKDAVERIKND